jgi:hypothetical protein
MSAKKASAEIAMAPVAIWPQRIGLPTDGARESDIGDA